VQCQVCQSSRVCLSVCPMYDALHSGVPAAAAAAAGHAQSVVALTV